MTGAVVAAPQPVVILGTGGNCVDIMDALGDVNAAAGREVYRCVGFLDDDAGKHGRDVHGVRVLGPLAAARQHLPSARFVFGIGSPRNFWRKPDILAGAGLPDDAFVTVVHPTASVSRLASLGRGVVILPHVTVASNARLGDHVVVLPSAVISHDVMLGAFSTVTGGVVLSGGVEVGRACYLGTGASIIGGARIGDGALVGMGAVVLGDVPPRTVVVGNPARRLRDVT